MADIVIVDDDPDTAEALAELMTDEGHEVRVAYNGEEGLRLLESKFPDLVMLDVEMPILDEPAMAYRMIIRDCGMENVPIAFLSGVPELREIAAQCGTPYFLGKPFRYGDVIALVRRALLEQTPPHPETTPA